MVSLLYLKNSFNLSDEELVERWAENVQWQFFGGMDYCEPRLPCDATQIGRFQRLLGEERLEQLLKATIECAVEIKAVRPADLERVIVDSTVQSKAIAHPVDSRLLEIARHKLSVLHDGPASPASRPTPRKARRCDAKPVATRTPNSSSGCARPSSASAPSSAW